MATDYFINTQDSDIMQLMYQQDVDLGFSWPASDHLKSLKQLDDISTIKQQNESTGEFFVDGETGEHIPLSKVQNNTQPKKEKVVEETPQVSQPDKSAQPSNYFSIDEYLEFLDNTIDDLQPQVVEQMAPNQDNVIGGLVDLVENGGNTVTVDETPEDIWQDIANLSELTGIDLNGSRQTDPVHTLINSNVSLTNASVELNQLQPNINQPFQPQVLDNVNNNYNKTLNYEPEQPFVTRPCNVYETPAYNQFGPYGEPAYGSPPYNPMNGEDGTPMDTVLSPGMPTPTFNNFQAPMETGDSRSYGGSSPMMGFPAEPGQMIFDGATNMNEMLNDIININSTNQVYGNKMTPDFMNINQAPYIPPPLNSSPPPLVTFLDDSNPLVGSSSNESCDSDSGVSMEQSPQSFYMGNQRMGRHSIEPGDIDQSFQRNKMKSINHNHTYD
uniref:Uncharacterized protein n=1 Tax=Ciona savignyi TaxID=51511 RepID=H2YIE4_CIOSA